MIRNASSAFSTRSVVSRSRVAPQQRTLQMRRSYSVNAPADLRYTKSHEWIRVSNGIGTVGITDFAQKALGDVVFVDLPATGKKLAAGVESVKAAGDVYAPVAGEVVEINQNLSSDPSLVNSSPFQDGWMFKLKLDNAKDVASLLDSKAYEAVAESSSH